LPKLTQEEKMQLWNVLNQEVAQAFPTPAVDPNLTIESPSSFTKFTDLKQTVSTLTAESIDHFFAMQSAAHQSLKGIGQPVIDAARKYAINASYIVAHAILESGWGTFENQSPKKQYLRMECI
jgi:beta-N-acetylglucosaminidase